MRPIAERAGLTHDPARLPVEPRPRRRSPASRPTLIQEVGPDARPVEDKRAELAALPAELRLTDDDVDEIRALGDNTGCMALKGASPEHSGEERPDRWGLDERLEQVARRWRIEPERDLTPASVAAS